MSKYYYAVRDGRKIGIYKTWAECELQTKGYSGAAYKKFSNYEDALKFINGKEKKAEVKDIENLRIEEMVSYVDGSFDKDNNYYSYGVVIFTSQGKETYCQKENDINMVDMRNVAGEIRGAMYAMEKALEQGKKTLYIHYDYMGIEKWAIGEWRTNRVGTKIYRDFYSSIKDDLKVIFIKVAAHSGIEYNEEADRLAKKALGISV